MTPAPRRVTTAMIALLMTTGCTMTSSSEPELRGPLGAEDVVRLDLRDPPTREEAGFAEGRNSLVLERVGEAVDVEILLPGGRVLRTEAFGVDLSGPLGLRPGESADRLHGVLLDRRLPDLDAVSRELMEEADALALDPRDIQAFVDQVGSPPSDSDNRVLTASPAAPPAIDVEVRYGSGGDWILSYSFTFPDPD